MPECAKADDDDEEEDEEGQDCEKRVDDSRAPLLGCVMALHRSMAKWACMRLLVSNPGMRGGEGNDDDDDDDDDRMGMADGPPSSSRAVAVTEDIWARSEENVARH